MRVQFCVQFWRNKAKTGSNQVGKVLGEDVGEGGFFIFHDVAVDLVDHILVFVADVICDIFFWDVEIEHEGDDLTIAFNNRFLIDSIRACSADKIKIAMSSKLMSINIQPAEASDEFSELFMLLPVRTKD